MSPRRLTDKEIGDALFHDRGSSGEQVPEADTAGTDACFHEDRFWDLARGSLDPITTGRILDHVADCPDCSLALRVARETLEASPMNPAVSRHELLPARVWAFLGTTVLRPAPALAYLILLLLSFPLYKMMRTATPSEPVPSLAPPAQREEAPKGLDASRGHVTPGSGLHDVRVVRLTGDLSLRGHGDQPPPLAVRLVQGQALLLKLFPDIEDLPKDPGSTLEIQLLQGDDLIAAATRRAADLDEDQSFTVLLDRSLLRYDAIYRVELTEKRTGEAPPGSAGSGSPSSPPLLRQSFRLNGP